MTSESEEPSMEKHASRSTVKCRANGGGGACLSLLELALPRHRTSQTLLEHRPESVTGHDAPLGKSCQIFIQHGERTTRGRKARLPSFCLVIRDPMAQGPQHSSPMRTSFHACRGHHVSVLCIHASPPTTTRACGPVTQSDRDPGLPSHHLARSGRGLAIAEI